MPSSFNKNARNHIRGISHLFPHLVKKFLEKNRKTKVFGTFSRDKQKVFAYQIYLLSSGLYRRLRSYTGSCCYQLVGYTTDHELRNRVSLTLPRRLLFNCIVIIATKLSYVNKLFCSSACCYCGVPFNHLLS